MITHRELVTGAGGAGTRLLFLSPSEAGPRVPRLPYRPGTIAAGMEYDGLVANIDFTPTIPDQWGMEPAADHGMDEGRFQLGLFGERNVVRQSVSGEMGHSASMVNPDCFVGDRLHDLPKDPEENDNIFDRHPEVAKRLKRELSKALRSFQQGPFGELAN